MLPEEVLQQIRDELLCLPSVGSSILEISHRSSAFASILAETQQLLRGLLEVPASHEILFLQGGSRLQFSTAPLNLGQPGTQAAYVVTGTWSQMAADEARRLIDIKEVWSGKSNHFSALPDVAQMGIDGNWSYLYFASNETIHGVQFRPLPTAVRAPLVCDMSSDFLSRPVNLQDFAMVFACAQKNAGIAGLTIVVVDRDRLREATDRIPGYLNLKSHLASDNLFNTPPTFAIYVLKLVLQWIRRRFGSLAEVEKQGLAKARLVYEAIDRHPNVYRGHAASSARSMANVTFFLPSEAAVTRFLAGARDRGMTDLKGHRSVGGLRASLYNGLPHNAAKALADYLDEFARTT